MNDNRSESQLGTKSLNINLADEEVTADSASLLSATIEATPYGIAVSANGYGSANSNEIVLVQLHKGSLCLFVWANINQEEPTHIIPLDGAKESNLNT